MRDENGHWYNKNTENLFQAILKLKTTNECRAFFRDLCTLEEIKNMEERWEVANLLNQNKLSYRQIAKKTGMSTTTISRIASWIKNGQGGYQTILQRVKNK